MYSKSIRWFLVASILIGSLFVGQDAYAQGGGGEGGGMSAENANVSANATAGSLNSFKVWNLKGGYVASGTGMRNLGKGNIFIVGIPKGSTVVAAFLYWNNISPKALAAHATGKFNGQQIAGKLIGTTVSPCWGTSAWESRSYRANVTSLVSGNGTYRLTGFASGRTDGSEPSASDPAPYLDGASLVIVYSQNKYPLTRVLLYDGAVETDWNRGAAKTVMGPLPAYPSFLAYTSFIGADGQNNYNEKGSFINGRPIAAADWDGTDRMSRTPGYSIGSLWDTERNTVAASNARGFSVGHLISSGSTQATATLSGEGLPTDSVSDCLVHVAQVLSVSNGNLDTDGDALRDGWEANGYDHNGDGLVDVPLHKMLGNPFYKNVYVEIDWMSEAGDNHHRPNDTVLNALKSAFKQANAANPDGQTGITLHIDRSNAVSHTQYLSNQCGAFFTEMEKIKTANMQAARYVTHHYQLWVHQLDPCLGGTSGWAQDLPGDDSIVSLGTWGPEQGTDAERIGTAMHELGHTLNLHHGYPYDVDPCTPGSGPFDGCGDDPYIPNHLSVMSYLYQTVGVIKNGQYGTWDYQRWDLNQLDETCLIENDGVGSAAALDIYGLRWFRYDGGTFLSEALTNGAANGPVDWNKDGQINPGCVSRSINSGHANDTDLEILHATKSEWNRLVFCGGPIGVGPCQDAGLRDVPVFTMDPLTDHELTYEEALKLYSRP